MFFRALPSGITVLERHCRFHQATTEVVNLQWSDIVDIRFYKTPSAECYEIGVVLGLKESASTLKHDLDFQFESEQEAKNVLLELQYMKVNGAKRKEWRSEQLIARTSQS